MESRTRANSYGRNGSQLILASYRQTVRSTNCEHDDVQDEYANHVTANGHEHIYAAAAAIE